MKKIKLIKNTCYNWLINYIPESIRKNISGFADKTVNFFNRNTPKKNLVWERKETK